MVFLIQQQLVKSILDFIPLFVVHWPQRFSIVVAPELTDFLFAWTKKAKEDQKSLQLLNPSVLGHNGVIDNVGKMGVRLD